MNSLQTVLFYAFCDVSLISWTLSVFSALDVLFASWWKWPLFFFIVQLHSIVLVSRKILTLLNKECSTSRECQKLLFFWAWFHLIPCKSSLMGFKKQHYSQYRIQILVKKDAVVKQWLRGKLLFPVIKWTPVTFFLMFFRCSGWSRWLAGLWSGPIAVFRNTDEDMWEAGEGRTLRPQQPCGSPHD